MGLGLGLGPRNWWTPWRAGGGSAVRARARVWSRVRVTVRCLDECGGERCPEEGGGDVGRDKAREALK